MDEIYNFFPWAIDDIRHFLIWRNSKLWYLRQNCKNLRFFRSRSTKLTIYPRPFDEIRDFSAPVWQNSWFSAPAWWHLWFSASNPRNSWFFRARLTKFAIFSCPINEIHNFYAPDGQYSWHFSATYGQNLQFYPRLIGEIRNSRNVVI